MKIIKTSLNGFQHKTLADVVKVFPSVLLAQQWKAARW